jgi:hypothetical protein
MGKFVKGDIVVIPCRLKSEKIRTITDVVIEILEKEVP